MKLCMTYDSAKFSVGGIKLFVAQATVPDSSVVIITLKHKEQITMLSFVYDIHHYGDYVRFIIVSNVK